MALVDADANLDSVAASLHDYRGICDYCGKQCDPELQDLNLVCCSFAKCPTPMVFHQCCVDEYLKKRKLGKDAKVSKVPNSANPNWLVNLLTESLLVLHPIVRSQCSRRLRLCSKQLGCIDFHSKVQLEALLDFF